METAIPVQNVSGNVLAKVIEYCKFHVEANKKGSDDKPAKSEDDVKVSARNAAKSFSLDKDVPTLKLSSKAAASKRCISVIA